MPSQSAASLSLLHPPELPHRHLQLALATRLLRGGSPHWGCCVPGSGLTGSDPRLFGSPWAGFGPLQAKKPWSLLAVALPWATTGFALEFGAEGRLRSTSTMLSCLRNIAGLRLTVLFGWNQDSLQYGAIWRVLMGTCGNLTLCAPQACSNRKSATHGEEQDEEEPDAEAHRGSHP